MNELDADDCWYINWIDQNKISVPNIMKVWVYTQVK